MSLEPKYRYAGGHDYQPDPSHRSLILCSDCRGGAVELTFIRAIDAGRAPTPCPSPAASARAAMASATPGSVWLPAHPTPGFPSTVAGHTWNPFAYGSSPPPNPPDSYCCAVCSLRVSPAAYSALAAGTAEVPSCKDVISFAPVPCNVWPKCCGSLMSAPNSGRSSTDFECSCGKRWLGAATAWGSYEPASYGPAAPVTRFVHQGHFYELDLNYDPSGNVWGCKNHGCRQVNATGSHAQVLSNPAIRACTGSPNVIPATPAPPAPSPNTPPTIHYGHSIKGWSDGTYHCDQCGDVWNFYPLNAPLLYCGQKPTGPSYSITLPKMPYTADELQAEFAKIKGTPIAKIKTVRAYPRCSKCATELCDAFDRPVLKTDDATVCSKCRRIA